MIHDDRITKLADRGRHIPLRCKNHPEKRWSTKNIDFIGARSIFYNLNHDPGMGPECPCSAGLLEVVEEECGKEDTE